jgi:hypothetical protein
MAEMSNHLENELYDHVLRNASYTSPTNIYVSLHTADPTDDGSGTEVSGGSYARTAVTMGAPTNGSGTNSADVQFPQCTSDWGSVTHIAIWDATTAGNMLFHTPLDTTKNITTGDVFKIASGSLTVTFA